MTRSLHLDPSAVTYRVYNMVIVSLSLLQPAPLEKVGAKSF